MQIMKKLCKSLTQWSVYKINDANDENGEANDAKCDANDGHCDKIIKIVIKIKRIVM